MVLHFYHKEDITMMKELTIENVEERFDNLFSEINKLNEDFTERNSVSLKQIYEAYEESRS